ncbi:CopD family protein [Pelagibius sp.]|uniref:CopD family protein n=1 Tax=Pelagibius sp. TaxID=1931238 RepID=UPI003B508B2A
MSSVEAVTLAAKLLSYGAALVATGALSFMIVFRSLLTAAEVAVIRRHVGLLLVIAVPASLAIVYATVALLSGAGLAGGFDAELWALVAGTAAGDAVWLRLAGLALLSVGLLHARLCLPALLAGGLLVALSFGLVGHTQDDPNSPWLHALLTLHLAAVAFWIGSLWPLLQLAGAAEGARVAAVMQRFGRIAGVFVACLLLAGAGLAALLLGGIAPLVTTAYGRVLLVKLALVVLLLGFAALNKWRLVPRLAAGEPGAALRLRRSIAAEIALVIAILLATAVLTSAVAPP